MELLPQANTSSKFEFSHITDFIIDIFHHCFCVWAKIPYSELFTKFNFVIHQYASSQHRSDRPCPSDVLPYQIHTRVFHTSKYYVPCNSY